jgi:hypothetical protein
MPTRKNKPLDPIPADIVVAMDTIFADWFPGGACWDGWRSTLRGAFNLPMSDADREFFRLVAEREPPAQRVKELWVCAGRRSGKDSVASLISAHAAGRFNPAPLRRGERALCLNLACDRDQAKIVLNYTRSYFEEIPELRALVQRETKDGFELRNGVDIVVGTNSFRAVRGRAILCAVLDELAFYFDENSASPDLELYNALKPGLATLPTSMLIGISSPYRRAGLLYKKYQALFGRDDGSALFIKAATRTLNPKIDPELIRKAFEEDSAAASAEWGAEFRSDLESFIGAEVISAAVVPGRYELPRIDGVQYAGFCDPSGGSADSMTLAIAHPEGDRAILDLVREIKPPFSPDDVAREFSDALTSYGIARVRGDRYGGVWPRERFAAHGVDYMPATKTKSDYYLAALPLLNAGRIELLDNTRLTTQLAKLERRTARGGKDSVDHPRGPGQHDDLINAAAGALVLAAEGAAGPRHLWIGVPTGPLSEQEKWMKFAKHVVTEGEVNPAPIKRDAAILADLEKGNSEVGRQIIGQMVDEDAPWRGDRPRRQRGAPLIEQHPGLY